MNSERNFRLFVGQNMMKINPTSDAANINNLRQITYGNSSANVLTSFAPEKEKRNRRPTKVSFDIIALSPSEWFMEWIHSRWDIYDAGLSRKAKKSTPMRKSSRTFTWRSSPPSFSLTFAVHFVCCFASLFFSSQLAWNERKRRRRVV